MHWHGVAVVRKVHIFKDVWVRGLSADGGALSSPIKWQKSDAKADMLLVALREKKHLPSPPHFANFKSYHRGITGSLEIR